MIQNENDRQGDQNQESDQETGALHIDLKYRELIQKSMKILIKEFRFMYTELSNEVKI